MKTIFYAWQSDLPGKMNRNFIEECLEQAIQATNKTRHGENALELDKDTQGVSGMPDVAKVIFDKIDACAVFVPDLSFVTAAGSGRHVPNPNVLIELGYALRAIGDRRIVALFNETSGSTEALPFDLRHKRWPLRYRVAEGATPDERRAARDELVPQLTDALSKAADRATADTASSASPRIDRTLPGSFSLPSPYHFADGLDIARVNSSVPGATAEGKLHWRNAPQAFLEVRPKSPRAIETYAEMRRRLQSGGFHLLAFGQRGAQWSSQNADGFVVGEVVDDEWHDKAMCITQFRKNTGGLLGIDQAVVEKLNPKMVIAGDRLRDDFIHALKNYLEFYRLNSDLPGPPTLYCGLEMIRDVYLDSGRGGLGVAGPCVEPALYHGIDEVTLDADPGELLRPLFAKLWDAVGLEYSG